MLVVVLAQKPLMPKGVEHETPLVVKPSTRRAQKPLMPKGVEHAVSDEVSDTVDRAQKPLMPKGVEHGNIAGLVSGARTGAETFDAERR